MIPSKEHVDALSKELRECASILDYVCKIIDALPIDAHPMTQFSTGVMALQGKWQLEQLGNYHTTLKYSAESKMCRDTLSEAIMEEAMLGRFQEFKLLQRLGEGSTPTAIIGEVADDVSLDLVILSMEAIYSKHVDANMLAEFIPCPVLLLPLQTIIN